MYHEDYDPVTTENDVALFFLNETLTDDSRLDVVTLNEDDLSVGDQFQVIGYGANMTNGSATDTLEYTHVVYYDTTKCENTLNAYFNGNCSNCTNMTLGTNQMCAIGV